MFRILKGLLQERKTPSPTRIIRDPIVIKISPTPRSKPEPVNKRKAPGSPAVIPVEKRKAPIPFRSSIHWAGMFQERPPNETSVPMRANQKPGPNMLLIVHSQKFMLGDVA